MDNFTLGVILGATLLAGTTRTQAQVNASDSVMNHAKGNKRVSPKPQLQTYFS